MEEKNWANRNTPQERMSLHVIICNLSLRISHDIVSRVDGTKFNGMEKSESSVEACMNTKWAFPFA